MKLAILCGALCGAMIGSAAAQALVNMDVDYEGASAANFGNALSTSTGNFNPSNPTETDTVYSTTWGVLSSSVPFTNGASQGGSTVIQGGWAVISNGTPPGPVSSTARYARLDTAYSTSSNVDGFRISVGDNGTGTGTVAGDGKSGLNNTISTVMALYVNKADFLNGFAAVSNLTLQGLSFNINVPDLSRSGASNVFCLIENAGQWYVSGASITSTSPTTPSTIGDLIGQTWYAYNPATFLFNTATPGTGVSGATLTDIQAAGALVQTVDADDSGANNSNGAVAVWDELAGIQITMVPEPSPILLLGFAAALLALAGAARKRAVA